MRSALPRPLEMHSGPVSGRERLFSSHENDNMVNLLGIFKQKNCMRRVDLLRRRQRQAAGNDAGKHCWFGSNLHNITMMHQSPPFIVPLCLVRSSVNIDESFQGTQLLMSASYRAPRGNHVFVRNGRAPWRQGC